MSLPSPTVVNSYFDTIWAYVPKEKKTATEIEKSEIDVPWYCVNLFDRRTTTPLPKLTAQQELQRRLDEHKKKKKIKKLDSAEYDDMDEHLIEDDDDENTEIRSSENEFLLNLRKIIFDPFEPSNRRKQLENSISQQDFDEELIYQSVKALASSDNIPVRAPIRSSPVQLQRSEAVISLGESSAKSLKGSSKNNDTTTIPLVGTEKLKKQSRLSKLVSAVSSSFRSSQRASTS